MFISKANMANIPSLYKAGISVISIRYSVCRDDSIKDIWYVITPDIKLRIINAIYYLIMKQNAIN